MIVIFAPMFSFLQATLWQKLEQWDRWLFIQLNGEMANPFFDSVMPFLRNGTHWAPLYLFLCVFVLMNFKNKGAWWMLFFVATVAITDMIGTYGFKHNIERIRPCNDINFFLHVRRLIDCPGGYSFTSNHAANHFGMGTFFFITFLPVLKKWAWVGFLWAALIAYAQIYVGAHYPLDILAGALLGIGAGLLTGKVFNKRYGFVTFDNQPTISS